MINLAAYRGERRRFAIPQLGRLVFIAMALTFYSSHATARASEAALPPVIFREVDIETITGLKLDKLRDAVTSFMSAHIGQRGFPKDGAPAGVWIFGFVDRKKDEGDVYVSANELIKAAREGKVDPNRKFFYPDVQFVWDLHKLHLGRWTFYLGENHEVRALVSSFVSDPNGKHKPVNLWIVIDTNAGYTVRDWGIDENPVY